MLLRDMCVPQCRQQTAVDVVSSEEGDEDEGRGKADDDHEAAAPEALRGQNHHGVSAWREFDSEM
jgi:hypothetical protein